MDQSKIDLRSPEVQHLANRSASLFLWSVQRRHCIGYSRYLMVLAGRMLVIVWVTMVAKTMVLVANRNKMMVTATTWACMFPSLTNSKKASVHIAIWLSSLLLWCYCTCTPLIYISDKTRNEKHPSTWFWLKPTSSKAVLLGSSFPGLSRITWFWYTAW